MIAAFEEKPTRTFHLRSWLTLNLINVSAGRKGDHGPDSRGCWLKTCRRLASPSHRQMVYGLYECSAGFDPLTNRQCKPAWGSLPTSYIEPFPKNLSFLYLHVQMSRQLVSQIHGGRSVFSTKSCFNPPLWSLFETGRAVGMTCPTRDDVWMCFVCVSLYPIFGTSFQLPSPPFSQEKTRCHRRISPVRSLLCIAHLTQGWVWTATEWYMALYNMKAGHAKKCLVGQWLKRWYGIDSSW